MAKITYIDAIKQAISKNLKTNDKIVILGQDVQIWGGYGGLFKGFYKEYANRVYDTPISEFATVNIAAGLAMAGYLPIVEVSFFDFILYAIDGVINQAAKIPFLSAGQFSTHIVFRAVLHSGRGYGATHSQSLEYMFLEVPYIKLFYPSSPNQAYFLTDFALKNIHTAPVFLLEHKLLHQEQEEFNPNIELKPYHPVQYTQGSQLTIVSYGRITKRVLQALTYFDKDTITFFETPFLKPLNIKPIIESVKHTKRLLVIEEGHGTTAAWLLKHIVENLPKGVLEQAKTLHFPSLPHPYNKEIENRLIPTVERIQQTIESLLKQ